jgi:hypothetical protein
LSWNFRGAASSAEIVESGWLRDDKRAEIEQEQRHAGNKRVAPLKFSAVFSIGCWVTFAAK